MLQCLLVLVSQCQHNTYLIFACLRFLSIRCFDGMADRSSRHATDHILTICKELVSIWIIP